MVATVVLPLINVTVAPGSGCEVVQAGAGPEHTTTDPLTVKPVTVSVTAMVCGLPPTAAPVLSVAAIVIVPVWVPGAKLAAVAFTLSVPVSVPDAGESTSHELLAASPVAVHETGRAHVPVSLTAIVCAVPVCPWATVNARLACDDSVQRGSMVSVTVNVSGLPWAGAPEASVAEMLTVL